MDFIKNIFGGKPWFRSFTAWGLIVFGLGEYVVANACGVDPALLSVSMCASASGVMKAVGTVLTVLGLRRRLN